MSQSLNTALWFASVRTSRLLRLVTWYGCNPKAAMNDYRVSGAIVASIARDTGDTRLCILWGYRPESITPRILYSPDIAVRMVQWTNRIARYARGNGLALCCYGAFSGAIVRTRGRMQAYRVRLSQ